MASILNVDRIVSATGGANIEFGKVQFTDTTDVVPTLSGASIYTAGGIGCAKGIESGTTLKAGTTLTVDGASTLTGNTSVGGTLGVTGLLTATGRVIVDDTTDATSTTDGSLQTDGGLSVAKKGYFGDNIAMATTKGLDFSADTKGVFKGLQTALWTNPTGAAGAQDPTGSGGEWISGTIAANSDVLGVSSVALVNPNEVGSVGEFIFQTTGHFLIHSEWYSSVHGTAMSQNIKGYLNIAGAGWVQRSYTLDTGASTAAGWMYLRQSQTVFVTVPANTKWKFTNAAVLAGDNTACQVLFVKLADL